LIAKLFHQFLLSDLIQLRNIYKENLNPHQMPLQKKRQWNLSCGFTLIPLTQYAKPVPYVALR